MILLLIVLLLFAFDSSSKVTLSMCVKNEADHYLREVLEEVRHYIDEAVIIDDASTDNTVHIIHEVLQGIPVHIIHNDVSRFSNEITLRRQQWEETIKTNPEWILNIDADHVFEKRMREAIHYLTNQDQIDVWCFRLYDFWDETHYRDDAIWCAHTNYRPFLIRYVSGIDYTWRETPQHCGHFPKNIWCLRSGLSDIRLKHFGWAKEEDRKFKHKRYMDLDPECLYGWPPQINSVFDPEPNLVEWVE